MKLAFLSESQADETALRILIEGLLEEPVEVVARPRRRATGVDSVFQLLPAVIKHLQYRTLAEGLVVVVDSDRSPVHGKAHAEEPDEECRLCRLRAVVDPVLSALRRQALERPPVRLLAGLAVPSIEAWLLAGRDPGVGEAAWRVSPRSVRELKRVLYESDRPSLEMEIEVMTREARRIVHDGKLKLLEPLFPGGFGPLVRSLRQDRGRP